MSDFRFALRTLSSRPGWTVAAVLCLAIATGANTAAFTVVNGFLLRPLPFDHADRLVMVALRDKSGTHPFSLDEYHALARSSTEAASLLAWTFYPVSLAGDAAGQMAEAQVVSSNYFDVLHVTPFAGRFFNDNGDGGDNAVLSYAVWRRRFSGESGVIGRAVRVNGRTVTVIGIAPPGFVGAMRLIAADLWLPARAFETLGHNAAAGKPRVFGVMGRLAPSVTTAAATARFDAIETVRARLNGAAQPPAVIVTPATGFGVPPAVQGSLMTLSGLIYLVMALLLAVAAANVAALVLARGTQTTQEIAVRLALGASRARVARRLLAEAAVLATAGSAAGAVAAVWLTRLLAANLTTPFTYVSYAIDISPDVRVLLYCAIATVATTAFCGLAPLRHASKVDVVAALKQSGRSASHGPGQLLRGLVVAQFATCMALLMAAGLLVRGYIGAQAASPGFVIHHLAAASLDLAQVDLDEQAGRRLYAGLAARVAALPGVSAVTLTDDAPFTGAAREETVIPMGERGLASGQTFSAGAAIVDAGYFRTLGVEIQRGRSFAYAEPAEPLVAIVNETMARRLAVDGSAVGHAFRLAGSGGRAIQVVGVVADLKTHSLEGVAQPVFYQPLSQRYSAALTLLARTHGDAASIENDISQAVHDANRDLAVVDLRPIDARLELSLGGRRGPAELLLAIALLAMLLGAIGLYGVMSLAVRRRARELAIRLAMGARPIDVRWLVLREGLGTIAVGLALGAAVSLAAGRLVRARLFGVHGSDPITTAAVCAFLAGAGLLALYFPARWASRVDPAESLRGE